MTDDDVTLLVRDLTAAAEPGPAGGPAHTAAHPWCAGAVVLAGHGPRTVAHEAVGWAVRYAGYDEATDRGVELPPERRIPMVRDTVFDLASLTKLHTAIAAVREIEAGQIGLDEPVVRRLPEFGAAGKQQVTARQLLTHTSGLRAELPFHDEPDRAARLRLLWREEPLTEPGTAYCYSDLNAIALHLLLERVTDRSFDVLVREGITGPLGMRATRFAPPAEWHPRIAATEDQRRPWGRLDRGMLHGVVHDENAWAFGGVAGHAGLFSTAGDLALLCRALLDGGAGVLRPESVALMLRDHLGDLGVSGPPHGLGFELDRPWFMGELSGPRTAGHSGFTGTSLVLDLDSGRFVILLANAVHPVRSWRLGNAPRARVGTWSARRGRPDG